MSSKASDQSQLSGVRRVKETALNLSSPMRRPRRRFKAPGRIDSKAADTLVTPSEIREEAESLRELLLLDLREQGYRLREIAGVLGLSRQRVNQIETRMIRRAVMAKLYGANRNPGRIVWKKNAAYVQFVTCYEFERRIEALNAFYEARFKQILRRLHKCQQGKISPTRRLSLFGKAWPFIERYENEPFHFSKLIADFPVLAHQPHVSQLLSRLRREGLLRRVGSIRVENHNLPEVLMVRPRLEASASEQIEKLASMWARKLQELQARYRDGSIRPNQSLRNHICAILRNRSRPTFDFEKALEPPREDSIPKSYASAASAYSRSAMRSERSSIPVE
jgi:DNA-binding transcriptional ArsR family regulator